MWIERSWSGTAPIRSSLVFPMPPPHVFSFLFDPIESCFFFPSNRPTSQQGSSSMPAPPPPPSSPPRRRPPSWLSPQPAPATFCLQEVFTTRGRGKRGGGFGSCKKQIPYSRSMLSRKKKSKKRHRHHLASPPVLKRQGTSQGNKGNKFSFDLSQPPLPPMTLLWNASPVWHASPISECRSSRKAALLEP